MNKYYLDEDIKVNHIKSRNFNIKNIIYSLNNFLIRLIKSDNLCDYSKWAREIYPFYNLYNFELDHPNKVKSIHTELRYNIISIIKNNLNYIYKKYFPKIDDTKCILLGNLLMNVVNVSLPCSLIENLEDRFNKYRKVLINWNIKHLHTFSF